MVNIKLLRSYSTLNFMGCLLPLGRKFTQKKVFDVLKHLIKGILIKVVDPNLYPLILQFLDRSRGGLLHKSDQLGQPLIRQLLDLSNEVHLHVKSYLFAIFLLLGLKNLFPLALFL